MTTEGKVWGSTDEVFVSESVSVHFLKIKSGTYCSEHRHAIKKNVFAVVKGKVIVRIWQEGPRIAEGENFFVPPKVMVDESVITSGQQAVIQAGYWHQFEAVEDSEVIEIYLAALAGTDIERRSQGGQK